MSLFKEEMDKEKKDFSAIGFRSQRRNLRVLPQTQKNQVNVSIDASRKALAPGKRISKTGKVYWESRRSRSDERGKNI